MDGIVTLQSLASSPLVISFGIIFVAELVDKTLLVTLLLATRYPALPVLLGAWTGFLAQTLIAVAAGALLGNLPHALLRWASVAAFAIFGLLMLLTEERIEDERSKTRAPFMVALLAIVMAEWGDATQVGTMALAARLHAPLGVFAGALLGLWAGAAVAVTLGRVLGHMVNPRWLRRAGGVVFLGLAVAAGLWRY